MPDKRPKRRTTKTTGARPMRASDELTARELTVLLLISHGLTNDQIALQLHIALPTVESHVGNVLSKLDACSRAHAVGIGMRKGLIK